MSDYQSRVFGQYTLVDKLATGGMAEIFLAKTRGYGGFEKTLVIKRLHPQYSDDHQFVKMLVDEAKITVQLQHSNIVQIFDLGRVGGQYYIAMELVAGKDLFHVLRALHEGDLQMPLEAACYVVSEICHGLHYAHSKHDELSGQPLQVIHRDVSPQNILVSFAGEVKLADFGIAKAAQRSTHTEVGVIKGKFYYMSPEQALGLDIDYRSDIFSTGIVLFEALTSTPLYDDSASTTLMEKVQKGAVKSPSRYRDDIPPALEAICMKALAADREERYQSALEMGRDLSEFIVSRGHAFTKVDLGEFLGALFQPTAAPTDPDFPRAEHVRPRPASGLSAPPGARATVAVAALAADLDDTARDLRTQPPPVPAAARLPEAKSAPWPSTLPPLTPLESAGPETRPVPKDETGAPRHVTPLPTPAIGSAEVLNHAQTTRLSKEEIERVNQAMLAATRGQGPLSTGELNSVIAAAIAVPESASPESASPESASPESAGPEPSGARTGLTRRPAGPDPRAARMRRRDRRLKTALGSVVVLIMLTAAAIIWLLAHPIPSPEQGRNQPTQSRVPQKPGPTAVTSRGARQPPRPTGDRAPAAHRAATLTRVRVSAPTPIQRFRLYVDGELHPLEGLDLHLTPGRHTVRARLLPQGTLTAEQTLMVQGSPLTIQL